MSVIAIVSQKGGAGKTTIATHLATAADAAGYITCLIDMDPQATAAAWGDWRQSATPEVITTPPARLGKTLENVRGLGGEIIIIDTPPNADAAAREAVRAADLVLIPCRPRAFDLHAVQTTADLIATSNKKAFVLFNAAPPRAPALIAEATAMVGQFGLAVAPMAIVDRAAYHHSTAAGNTAAETDAASKAALEIVALWEWTCVQVDMPTRKQERKGAAA